MPERLSAAATKLSHVAQSRCVSVHLLLGLLERVEVSVELRDPPPVFRWWREPAKRYLLAAMLGLAA